MGTRKRRKEKQNPVKLLLIGMILVGMLVGFYFYVNNKMEGTGAVQETDVVTKTQQVLLRNMEIQYPPSPKEVVRYYFEITQCFYNEENTDEQIQDLALQIQKLYDDELIANQTQEAYMQNLISEIAGMKQNGVTLSHYSTSPSTEVDFFEEDGYDWARLYANFTLRQGSIVFLFLS